MEYRKNTLDIRDTNSQPPLKQRDIERPVITVDYERYTHFLESSDLTEAQKQDLLQVIWEIVVEFVSLGFGIHPLQQAKLDCGKTTQPPPKSTLTADSNIYLDHSILNDVINTAPTGVEK